MKKVRDLEAQRPAMRELAAKCPEMAYVLDDLEGKISKARDAWHAAWEPDRVVFCCQRKLDSEQAAKDKVAALTNPKVTAALHAKLNEPNKLAFDQIKQRNTERVSAERKY